MGSTAMRLSSLFQTVICAIGLLFSSPAISQDRPQITPETFDDFVAEYLVAYFKFEPVAAIDHGITGQEEHFFGEHANTRNAFDTVWADFSREGLSRKRATYEAFAKRLNNMRDDVASLDDNRKVNYNMMVARTNMNNLWFYEDFRNHLAMVCPSTLSVVLKSSQLALEKDDDQPDLTGKVVLRLKGIPDFLGGCIESILAARKTLRSLDGSLLTFAANVAKGSIAQLDKVTELASEESTPEGSAKLAKAQAAAQESIAGFAARLEEWSKDDLTKERVIGKGAFLRRWRYGYGRPDNAIQVANDAKKELDSLSMDFAAGVDKIFSRVFPGDTKQDTTRGKLAVIQEHGAPADIDEAIAKYQEKTDAFISMARSLFDLPDVVEITVQESPPVMKGLLAAYKPSPIFGNSSSSGYFYVDNPLDGHPDENMVKAGLALHHQLAQGFFTAHEVAPGHALQFAVFQGIKKDLHPVRFLDITSDVLMGDYLAHENLEGWGLYAESLPFTILPEMYSRDEATFALQSRAWRAARAYIETLVQMGEMDEAQGAEIFRTKVFLPDWLANSRVPGFYRLPCQRSSYYLGARKIETLVEEVRRIKGKEKLTIADHQEFNLAYFRYGMIPISLFSEALLNEFRVKAGQRRKMVPLLAVFMN